MPMFGSMCHGGMLRNRTFSLIAFAHGRASSYVSKDIGAIEPGRWQVWHDRWRMGATSFVKVASRSGGVLTFGICPSAMKVIIIRQTDSPAEHRSFHIAYMCISPERI